MLGGKGVKSYRQLQHRKSVTRFKQVEFTLRLLQKRNLNGVSNLLDTIKSSSFTVRFRGISRLGALLS